MQRGLDQSDSQSDLECGIALVLWCCGALGVHLVYCAHVNKPCCRMWHTVSTITVTLVIVIQVSSISVCDSGQFSFQVYCSKDWACILPKHQHAPEFASLINLILFNETAEIKGLLVCLQIQKYIGLNRYTVNQDCI